MIEKSLKYLEDENIDTSNISKHPCRLVVIDPSFENAMSNAWIHLSKEGLNIEHDTKLVRDKTEKIEVAPSTGIGKAIEVVRDSMKDLNHALYHGHIYTKAKTGKTSSCFCKY